MDFPKSVPNIGLVNGRFVDENVGTGQPGSLIPAEWGNSVTEEILSVITGAGLTPDEAQVNQLFLSIKSLVTNGAPPNATEIVRGVVRFGTQEEIDNASNGAVAVSPKTLGVKFTEYFKQATEAVFGYAKIATQSQTNSGVDDTTFVTPKKFSAGLAALIVKATSVVPGIARIATQTEVDNSNGTDSIVTPQTLGKKFTDYFKQATESVLGFARVATQSQTNSGVDDTTFVTPKKFSAGLAALIVQATTVIPGIARIATQTEVDNSTGANLIVTPVTMGQKFTDYFKQATVTSLGVAKVATQTLVNAGADALTFVTPSTLRSGVIYSLTLQGYIVLPAWLGGFTLQWGSVAAATTINYPVAFTTVFVVIPGSNAAGNFVSATSITATSAVLQNSGNQATSWVALGRVL